MGWDGPVTHRQFKTWEAWDREELDKPNRSDFYQMQIAAEIRRFRFMIARVSTRVDVNQLKIRFNSPTPATAEEIPGATHEEKIKVASAWAKARWFGRVGMPSKVIYADAGDRAPGSEPSR